MARKLIIFDFDGVLVDSRSVVIYYYSAILKHFDLPSIDWNDPYVASQVFSMSHRQFMGQYAEGERLEELCSYSPPYTTQEMLDSTPLEVGVAEAIPQLAKEYNLAICTNRGESVDHYLEYYKLKECFSYVVTAQNVRNPKPDPEGVHKILDYFDAKPEETLYIGDSEVDYYAATAAGVHFLAFGGSLFGSPFIKDHRKIAEYFNTFKYQKKGTVY